MDMFYLIYGHKASFLERGLVKSIRVLLRAHHF